MWLERNFLQGKMNKDIDQRVFPSGQMRHAENIRITQSEGSDVGSIENCLGNEKLTELSLGDNAETIGADRSLLLNKLYWLVKSDTGSYFIEFDIKTQTVVKILEDTRSGDDNILNLNNNNHVDRIIIIEDTDNNLFYAAWTDKLNPIRLVDIEHAKTFGANNFDQEDISLLKKAPIHAPELVLTNTSSSLENYMEERFLRFGIRYRYRNNQFSAISPMSEVAFDAKGFNYNYATSSNDSMVNRYNKAEISFNTGTKNVEAIELIVKESQSNTAYVSEAYVKEEEGWSNDQTVTITFDNQKLKKVLPSDEIGRMFDAVPEKAGGLGFIQNQLLVSDYFDGHDMIDSQGNDVVMDFSLVKKVVATPSGAYRNIKSLRNYEVGVGYLDKDTRLSPLFTSKTNDFYVKGNEADELNQYTVEINHTPPAFATHYRFYVRQSKEDYETIVPTLFYQDGPYAWIRLEAGESGKISEGDYLVVKADTIGLLDDYVETRVLEIKSQPRNFLEEDDSITDLKQEEGLYFKVKPEGFRINEEDFTLYEFTGYDNTKPGYSNPIRDEVNVIEKAVYYGNGGLDDLTESGTYTHNTDIRYLIEIEATGATDTFKWSNDDGQTFSAPISITGASQAIENGLSVTFGNTTGHLDDDYWIISAKSKDDDGFGNSENNFTYAMFKSIASNGNINEDDVIEGGARITIEYNEYGEGDTRINKQYTSTKDYANLEEWWFGDNIADDFNYPDPEKIWFRRGRVENDDNAKKFLQDPTGDMVLIIKSVEDETGADGRVKAGSKLTIFQSDNNILLETKATENNTDIFWELPITYPITEDGFHGSTVVGDIEQTDSVAAEILLPFTNCFSWGNGFESYKIKDSLTGKKMLIDSKPWTFVEDYKKRNRRASITFSSGFEQTTRYNSLNEFNQSLSNFIDLDDAFGKIERIHEKDTDLVVFQTHRIQPIGFKKQQVFNSDGTAQFVGSNATLNLYKPYTGEFGITKHSFAHYGNTLFGIDIERGAPIRLGNNGVFETSLMGMTDFFKDLLREYPDSRYEACYNPYFDEYLVTIDDTTKEVPRKITIGFSDRTKGWVSFYEFGAEKMTGIGNRLYSFKEGQLWRHNSENVPRNNFYGVQYQSKVSVIFSEFPSDDKLYKAIKQIGDTAWSAKLTTDLTKGSIDKDDFELRESNFYAYTRRGEGNSKNTSFAVNGIGNTTNINSTTLSFANEVCYVTSGDKIYQNQSNTEVLIGTVDSVEGKNIVLVSIDNTPLSNTYTYSKKTPEIEGANIRGHYLEVELTSDAIDKVELFAVGANTVKSYV